MNRIEQMIHDLCVNGVKRVKLGELGSFENIGVDKKTIPGEQLVTLLNYVDIYHHKKILPSTPQMIVSASDKKISACTVERGDIFVTPSSETVDDIGHSAVIEETIPNAVYSYHIMRFRPFEKNITQSYFINYLFDTPNVKKQMLKFAQGLTRFGLSKEKFGSIEIPLPPLEIQGEIVKILDRFAVLTAELEAELEARRKQYEYYRTRLLSFAPDSTQVQWRALGEVCKFSQGTQIDKELQYDIQNPNTLPFLRIIDFTQGNEPPRYVSDEYKNYLVHEEDISMVRYGAVGFVCTGKFGVLANNLFKITPIEAIAKRFLYHFLNSYFVQSIIKNASQEGGLPAISFKTMANIPIPIPSLAEQERIVNILDKFDQLVNGVKDSIPELIDKVQKQYEYYRNKLLTFPEA